MQHAAQVETVAVGQHHVKHHHIERLLLEHLPHPRRILGRTHIKPVAAQIHRQRITDLAMVVDDEDARRGICGGIGH